VLGRSVGEQLHTFFQAALGEWPQAVITNPKPAVLLHESEPIGRIFGSTHIRVLAFSPAGIASVEVCWVVSSRHVRKKIEVHTSASADRMLLPHLHSHGCLVHCIGGSRTHVLPVSAVQLNLQDCELSPESACRVSSLLSFVPVTHEYKYCGC
jgi:hypothetical protein